MSENNPMTSTTEAPKLGTKKRFDVRQMVIMAMLATLSYVVMLFGRIPVVLFLKYDPKDVIIAISGFMYGPVSAVVISVVVSLVEMFTVSDTGPIGLLMNVLSTCAFVCPAAIIYRRSHSMKGAVAGLISGALIMTAVMLLWNWLITPIYLNYPRQDVVKLLVPAFLPFNLLKAGLNATLTILLYKPVVTALRKARLLPPSESTSGRSNKWGVMLVALVLLATFILLVLVMNGTI